MDFGLHVRTDATRPPPVPPRSPLRTTPRTSISNDDTVACTVDAVQGRERQSATLNMNINILPQHFKTHPAPAAHGSDPFSSGHRPTASNCSSYASVYTQDSILSHVSVSMVRPPTHGSGPLVPSPTSTRTSLSSSRPVSLASTQTDYSTAGEMLPVIVDSSADHKMTRPYQPTAPEEFLHTTMQQLFDMIEQLSPIIYQPSVNSNDTDDYSSDAAVFPPHPGVRPPSSTARKTGQSTLRNPILPSSSSLLGPRQELSKRRCSLRFGRRRLRGAQVLSQ